MWVPVPVGVWPNNDHQIFDVVWRKSPNELLIVLLSNICHEADKSIMVRYGPFENAGAHSLDRDRKVGASHEASEQPRGSVARDLSLIHI